MAAVNYFELCTCTYNSQEKLISIRPCCAMKQLETNSLFHIYFEL